MHYWLHFLKHDSQSPGCTIALTLPPAHNGSRSAKLETAVLRTANYRSWEELSRALWRAGISNETLRIIKLTLDNEGLDIQELDLSDEQLATLGFGPAAR